MTFVSAESSHSVQLYILFVLFNISVTFSEIILPELFINIPLTVCIYFLNVK